MITIRISASSSIGSGIVMTENPGQVCATQPSTSSGRRRSSQRRSGRPSLAAVIVVVESATIRQPQGLNRQPQVNRKGTALNRQKNDCFGGLLPETKKRNQHSRLRCMKDEAEEEDEAQEEEKEEEEEAGAGGGAGGAAAAAGTERDTWRRQQQQQGNKDLCLMFRCVSLPNLFAEEPNAVQMATGLVTVALSFPGSRSAAQVTPTPPPAPASFREASAFNGYADTDHLGLFGQSLGKWYRQSDKGAFLHSSSNRLCWQTCRFHFQTSAVFQRWLPTDMLPA